VKIWHSALFAFFVGFLVAYYWRGLGDMTVGKLYKG
jgi:hypothetical protein